MEKKYIPATTTKQLIENLNPNLIIDDKAKDFYVEIYEKQIINLLIKYIRNTTNPRQTYFVTGQVGTGKTSGLLKIKRTLEADEKYKVIHFDSRDYDLYDINTVDLLIIIGAKILNELNDPVLSEKYLKKLDELKQMNNGQLEKIHEETLTNKKKSEVELGVKARINLINFIDLGIKALTRLHDDHEFRTILRKIFKIKKRELFDLINEIIKDFNDKFKGKTKLLLILDELEKISDEGVKDIFRNYIKQITQINCLKILTFPLSERKIITSLSTILPPLYFSIRLTSPPFGEADEEGEKAKDILKKVLEKRIAPGYLEKFFVPEAIDYAIEMSGGNLRQYIRLLFNAVMEAHDESKEISKVTKEHVDFAVRLQRQSLSFALDQHPEFIEVIGDIIEHKTPFKKVKDNILRELLQQNIIYFYYNSDIWYDVNPLIKETVLHRLQLLKKSKNG